MPSVNSKSQREFFDEEFSGPIYVHAPLVYSPQRVQARASGRPLTRQQELEITAGFMRKMDAQLKGHEMDMCHSKYRIGRIMDCKTDASHTTRIKFKIYKDTEKGRRAYHMIKAGRMRGLSLTSIETATPTRVLEVKGVRVALCFRGARDGTWLEEMKNENGNYKPFDSENNNKSISQNKIAASSSSSENKNDNDDDMDCIPDDEFRQFQSIPCFCECEGACSTSVSAGTSSSSSSEIVPTDENLIYLRVEATNNEMSDQNAPPATTNTGAPANIGTPVSTTDNSKGPSPPAASAPTGVPPVVGGDTNKTAAEKDKQTTTEEKKKRALPAALAERNRKAREEAEARRRSSSGQNGRRRGQHDGASDMADNDADGYDAEHSADSSSSGGRRGGFEDESRTIDERTRDLTHPAFKSSGTPMLEDLRNEYSRAREERAATQSELRLLRETIQRLQQQQQPLPSPLPPQVPPPSQPMKEQQPPSIVGQPRDAAENERIRQLEAELRDAKEALDMTAISYIDEVQNVTGKPLSEINKSKIRKEWTDHSKRQRYVDDLNDLKNSPLPQPLQRSNNYNRRSGMPLNHHQNQAPRMAVAAASKFGGGGGGKRMRGSRGGRRRSGGDDVENDDDAWSDGDDVEEDNNTSQHQNERRDGLFGMLSSSSRVSASRMPSSNNNNRQPQQQQRKQRSTTTTTPTSRKVAASNHNQNKQPQMGGSEETLRRFKAEVRATKRHRNEDVNDAEGDEEEEDQYNDEVTSKTTKKQQRSVENPFKAHVKAAFYEVDAHPAAHPETGKTYLVHKNVLHLLQKAREEYNSGQIEFRPMEDAKSVNSVSAAPSSSSSSLL
jgi:hypothetical protein